MSIRLFAGPLDSPHELIAMQRAKRSRCVFVILTIVVVTAVGLMLAFQNRPVFDPGAERSILEGAGYEGELFLRAQEEYAQTLVSLGFPVERELFAKISSFLMGQAADALYRADENEGTPTKVLIGEALLRLSFAWCIAWKLGAASILVGFFLGRLRMKSSRNLDLLAQTGNGRLFFSGARLGFGGNASPAVQLRGLACPRRATRFALAQSALGELLDRTGCANPLNNALARIILAHPTWPYFVPRQGENGADSSRTPGIALDEITRQVTAKVLDLLSYYRSKPHPIPLPERPHCQEQGGGARLAETLQAGFDRLLTNEERTLCATFHPAEIVTLILALFAGRTLAYEFTGGQWRRKSNFLGLSARAVLLSLSEFGALALVTRTRLRRALVLGSSTRPFGSACLPLGATREDRILARWVELLLAAPKEIAGFRAAAEIEESATNKEARGSSLSANGPIG